MVPFSFISSNPCWISIGSAGPYCFLPVWRSRPDGYIASPVQIQISGLSFWMTSQIGGIDDLLFLWHDPNPILVVFLFSMGVARTADESCWFSAAWTTTTAATTAATRSVSENNRIRKRLPSISLEEVCRLAYWCRYYDTMNNVRSSTTSSFVFSVSSSVSHLSSFAAVDRREGRKALRWTDGKEETITVFLSPDARTR